MAIEVIMLMTKNEVSPRNNYRVLNDDVLKKLDLKTFLEIFEIKERFGLNVE